MFSSITNPAHVQNSGPDRANNINIKLKDFASGPIAAATTIPTLELVQQRFLYICTGELITENILECRKIILLIRSSQIPG